MVREQALDIGLGVALTALVTWRNGHAETVSPGSRVAARPLSAPPQVEEPSYR